MSDAAPLLEIAHLRIAFETEKGRVRAVDDVSIRVERGRAVGLVGESGCGKSVTALSVLGLIADPPGRVLSGSSVQFEGEELVAASPARMREVRGNKISMIFQEPMTSLNPVFTIGEQIGEAVRLHQRVGRATARERSIEMLRRVGMPSPEIRVDDYPHQLSGGMRQRVMIAMALSCNPSLLIADEPTTALDVTIQAQILALLGDLRRARKMALLLITHDLGVVAETCDDVVVMYAGKIVESAPATAIFAQPRHPYTAGLLDSIPGAQGGASRGQLRAIPGVVPPLANLPSGCRFRDRCDRAEHDCAANEPPLLPMGPQHFAACFHPRIPSPPAGEG